MWGRGCDGVGEWGYGVGRKEKTITYSMFYIPPLHVRNYP